MSQAAHYRPLQFQSVTGWRRLAPLARQEFATLFRGRWGVALFFVCLMPLIGKLVMLLIMFGVLRFGPSQMVSRLQGPMRTEMAAFDPRSAAFYVEHVLAAMPGMVFFLLLTSVVVARSVARDRATNALELYWTRGISPRGYVLAKWVGGCMLVGLVTVVGPLFLWSTAVLLAEDWSLFLNTGPGVLRALPGLVGMTMLSTAVGTMISAIATSANLAVVLWCVLLVGSSALGSVLAFALKEPWLQSCLSFWHAGAVLVRELAGLPQPPVPRSLSSHDAASVTGSVIVVVTVVGVCILLARRRLRIGEALQ